MTNKTLSMNPVAVLFAVAMTGAGALVLGHSSGQEKAREKSAADNAAEVRQNLISRAFPVARTRGFMGVAAAALDAEKCPEENRPLAVTFKNAQGDTAVYCFGADDQGYDETITTTASTTTKYTGIAADTVQKTDEERFQEYRKHFVNP